ncbi:NADH-quinone oxidoreductase subunit J [Wohlfahrtiimonas chitiniclastica]|uniref:NADH-quinone oxidoreductase subunit J n=2 Tax=Wohlfahrtiimonas chitiniclastica TaxID=400946 RepID=L8XYL6_9GAMM|nr:NADH-quinone oxidoreductase subunit J [Wohlfahrtiimonas chitiniclastica]ELV07855.1 NADH-quinone oxidoreductase subunit J [Wohlfahrtiimonas chitiniclastica SH04]KZS23482.1 NADH-quinone oxidoreductase subunit J [Wohlfahrtiimonas chitiniclastica]MBS7815386.1 NADH-quinone oxidoreductase subunit J [Wohlfahrtiimonas chitiniclastica]MBS7817436.1 NADH-quinone oxidoreductase subunit J [Wohlfahrtiimonas chitiniclastica]MBS7819272.1 NADH-quinone oxidoreductase subunit J [Wohlfahrtiimonas chitiniclasti
MLLKILFYVFALILIYSAVRVITARNPVTAVMHLILCFVTTSATWMLIQAEFLGLALIVIYVGAVMVLFLFVVMMIDISTELVKQGFVKYLPLGIVLTLIMIVEMAMVLVGKQSLFQETHPYAAQVIDGAMAASYSNTKQLGLFLYTHYIYAFEIVALILLVGMIAAISLTLRPRRAYTRFTPVSEQLKAHPEDRLQVVKMEPSKWEALPVEAPATEKGEG